MKPVFSQRVEGRTSERLHRWRFLDTLLERAYINLQQIFVPCHRTRRAAGAPPSDSFGGAEGANFPWRQACQFSVADGSNGVSCRFGAAYIRPQEKWHTGSNRFGIGSSDHLRQKLARAMLRFQRNLTNRGVIWLSRDGRCREKFPCKGSETIRRFIGRPGLDQIHHGQDRARRPPNRPASRWPRSKWSRPASMPDLT